MQHALPVQADLEIFPQGRSPKPKKSTMRGRAFVRLFMELQKMQRSRLGVTLRELAEETGVSTRTIRRDLETLQEAGFPLVDEFHDIEDERRPARRWRVFDQSEVA